MNLPVVYRDHPLAPPPSRLCANWLCLEPLEPRIFLSATSAPTPTQLVAQANNPFAFDLYQQLASENTGQNVFFSPYSAASALEMTLQGAKGATATEMILALHLPSADLAQAGISALYQLFQPNPNAGYTLSAANRIWVNENFKLLSSFITSEQNTFGATPQTIDFSNPTAAAQNINVWVAAQTNNKIQNLISPDNINALTRLILVNAIYFKGSWASPFDPSATQSQPFQVSTTQSESVPMMYQSGFFGYYQQSGADGFQALDLPYATSSSNNSATAPTDTLDMLLILPTASDFSQVESSLSPSLFSQITSNLSNTNINVDLPKFTLNETYNLIPALTDLGIRSAFDEFADFSGISSSEPLHISFVRQKAYISVDETGTEAAAATGIGIGTMAVSIPTATFNADHPFIFAIRDEQTNTILFMGRVLDPSGDAATGTTTNPSNPTTPTGPTTPTNPSNPTTPTTPVTPTSKPVNTRADRRKRAPRPARAVAKVSPFNTTSAALASGFLSSLASPHTDAVLLGAGSLSATATGIFNTQNPLF